MCFLFQGAMKAEAFGGVVLCHVVPFLLDGASQRVTEAVWGLYEHPCFLWQCDAVGMLFL